MSVGVKLFLIVLKCFDLELVSGLNLSHHLDYKSHTMSSEIIRNAVSNLELYTLDMIDINSIDVDKLDYEEIKNFFWYPSTKLRERLFGYLNRLDVRDRIIDVGCGYSVFHPATHVIDFKDDIERDRIGLKCDLDFDIIPVENNYFNFAHCRHTLEDIQNPQHAFNELCRISSRGYIETPSPLIELCKGVDASGNYRGYIHHRYIVWSDAATNTLHFLPKYPIVENLHISERIIKLWNFVANNYPLYWNNYYLWDDKRLPKINVYRHGINLDIHKDYARLLLEAVEKSMEYAREFMSWI